LFKICSPNSQCANTPGSYRCDCKEGFRSGSDPRSCVGNENNTAKFYSTINYLLLHIFTDIDECAETARLCQQNCANTWGSYQCSCQSGYTLVIYICRVHHKIRSLHLPAVLPRPAGRFSSAGRPFFLGRLAVFPRPAGRLHS
jgi:hypothetical protein